MSTNMTEQEWLDGESGGTPLSAARLNNLEDRVTGVAGDLTDFAAGLPATFVPKWKTATAYTVGQVVLAPDGATVKVVTAHTAGASYDATKFAVADGPAAQVATSVATAQASIKGKSLAFGAGVRNLGFFHTRLAGRRIEPVPIVTVSHSWGEGCGINNAGGLPSAHPGDYMDFRFDIVLGRRLRRLCPVGPSLGDFNPGAIQPVGGYYDAAFPYGGPPPPLVAWEVVDADNPDDPDYVETYQTGLGCKSARIPNGNYMQKTVVCTSFDIHYTKQPGGGQLRVYINGGEVAQIDTSASSVQGGFIWKSGPLGRGQRQIRVLAYAGSAMFDGAYIYDGDEVGIKSVLAAKGGNAINHIRYGSGGGGKGCIPDIAAQKPALVNIALLTNDVANPGTDIALTKGQMLGLISEIRAECVARGVDKPSFLITIPLETAIASTITWAQVRAAMYDIANTDTGSPFGTSTISVLDLNAYMPSVNELSHYGGSANDGLHLNARGYHQWAEITAAFLAP